MDLQKQEEASLPGIASSHRCHCAAPVSNLCCLVAEYALCYCPGGGAMPSAGSEGNQLISVMVPFSTPTHQRRQETPGTNVPC